MEKNSQFLSLLAIAIKYVSADYSSILETIQTFERDMFTFDPLNDNVLSSIVANITDYGCWCNFNNLPNKVIHSSAPVLDDFDQICKTLVNGYSCGRIDPALQIGSNSEFENDESENKSCDPTTQIYNSGLNIEDIYMIGMFGDPVENLKMTCEEQNPGIENSCARTACLIEGNFILGIFKIWNDSFYQAKIDLNLLGSNPNFNRKIECPTSIKHRNMISTSIEEDNSLSNFETGNDEEHSIGEISIQSNLELDPEFFCCGSYPKVEPFKQDKHQTRKCCGNKTYNSVAMMCCNVDGEMRTQTVCSS